jgi:hypothetical protein
VKNEKWGIVERWKGEEPGTRNQEPGKGERGKGGKGNCVFTETRSRQLALANGIKGGNHCGL